MFDTIVTCQNGWCRHGCNHFTERGTLMARYGYRDSASAHRYGYNYPHSRRYVAESNNPTSWENFSDKGLYPSAYVSIDMPAETPLREAVLEHSPRSIRYEVEGKGGGLLSSEEVDKISAAQAETPQMFVSRPGVVSSAFSHRSMRHSAGKLLGMAFDDLKGHRLMAAHSLSPHSSKLARKALDAGLLEPNPDNPEGIVSNDLGFDDNVAGMVERGPTDFSASSTTHGGDSGGERSTESVNFASRALMRRLNPKPSPQVTEPEPNYEQLKLDGM